MLWCFISHSVLLFRCDMWITLRKSSYISEPNDAKLLLSRRKWCSVDNFIAVANDRKRAKVTRFSFTLNMFKK